MQSNHRRGQVIWVTGMSGAGKTTLCRAVEAMLKPVCPQLVRVDGDAVRELFGSDLDYSETSRRAQIGRLRRLAAFLAEQGQIALVAALYSHPDLLAENRRVLPGYFEVYLKASLDLVRRRDSKGLYAGALAGRTPNVVGVDIPWHAPSHPDLVLDADRETPVESLARDFVRQVPGLAAAAASLSAGSL